MAKGNASLAGVVMGSKPDWDTMARATQIARDVPHECELVSALRAPVMMAKYAQAAVAPAVGVPADTIATGKAGETVRLEAASDHQNQGGTFQMTEAALHRRDFMLATASLGVLAARAARGEGKPFRIGMVGAQNSHAQAYSELINLKDAGAAYGQVRVTHIWGEEDARTREVAEKCQIPNIVGKHTDMIGQVDGVICVRRHGGKHLEDALPFLQAKVPAYVDKPLACSVADARALIAAAQASGVGFSSFSTLRFAPETTAFVEALRAEAGELRAGTSAGHCEPESEYGGIFFYGIHAVELMTAVWGYGVESVVALRHGPNMSALCAYRNGATVSLELLGDAKYVFHLSAFGTKGWKTAEVGTGNAYAAGMPVILATLIEQSWPIDAAHLVEPVQILAAVELSAREGRRVALAELG